MITLLAMTSVCHEIATVTKELPDNQVQVMVKRSEACGSCSAQGACQSLGGQTKDFFLVLDNRVKAQLGQRVKITLSEAAVVKASAILYLIPALSLIGSALVGNTLAPRFNMPNDAGAMIGAILGLIIGFTCAYFLAKRAEKSKRNVPVITSIVSNDEMCTSASKPL